ncbi:MAG: stalk domain-containing protein [Defluviitaleaceae bacterium]|nr:stalk domain-containing protein [Defluviitaleaceae bacterium]
MRKLFIAILILIGILSMSVLAYAQEVNVTIDGVHVVFLDQEPVVVDGRTLVPVRGVFEQLGFYVDWDNYARAAILSRTDFEVIITIDSDIFTTNGASHNLEVPAQSIGGRTMLPIRAVLESVGYDVGWDNETRAVLVNTTPQITAIANIPIPDNLTVRMISAGHDHATAILSDNSLWVWGSNSNGALGGGTGMRQHRPMRLMQNVSFVAAGYNFTTAIRTDGTLWAWGANSRGQLGDGTTVDRHSPVQIMDDVIYVSAGNTHAVAIRRDGTLWGWGSSNWGQLGDGISEGSHSPVMIMENVIDVVAGDTFTAVIRSDNSLWAWGGTRSTGDIWTGLNDFYGNEIIAQIHHQPIKLLDDAVSVSGGSRSLFAVRENGYFWSTGEITVHARRGLAADADFSELKYGVSNVSIRQQHAIALRDDGTVWTWGNNNVGQRGDGTIETAATRNFDPSMVLDDVIAVSAGRIFSMAIRSDGSLWTWGGNHNGQLGDDTIIGKTTPTMVIPFTPFTPQTGVAEVSAASHHTMAIMQDGTLWAWGFNNTGQFGNGTTTNRDTPAQVSEGGSWFGISAGSSHAAAIRGSDNGTLWAWGGNTHGQLGDNTNLGAAWPVAVGESMIFGGILIEPGREVRSWSKVAVGGGHTMAIQDNGALWAMGANVDGQLGDGTTRERNWPVQIGQYSWKYVAANTFHTAAIREDGTLWTWGRNSHGQLGNGTETASYQPIQVGTDNNWVSVSLGSNHTVAIKSDGSLWAWGSNARGQLGDGTMTNSSLPVRIGTDSNWASVSAGGSHTVAIRTDGSFWAWGSNSAGQLGDGTSTNRYAPIRVLENIRTASAGFNNTFVIRTDGTLWGFGDNGFAQLGDGTHTRRYEPVQII